MKEQHQGIFHVRDTSPSSCPEGLGNSLEVKRVNVPQKTWTRETGEQSKPTEESLPVSLGRTVPMSSIFHTTSWRCVSCVNEPLAGFSSSGQLGNSFPSFYVSLAFSLPLDTLEWHPIITTSVKLCLRFFCQITRDTRARFENDHRADCSTSTCCLTGDYGGIGSSVLLL